MNPEIAATALLKGAVALAVGGMLAVIAVAAVSGLVAIAAVFWAYVVEPRRKSRAD